MGCRLIHPQAAPGSTPRAHGRHTQRFRVTYRERAPNPQGPRDIRDAGCWRTHVNTRYSKCTHNTQYLGHYTPLQQHTVHAEQPHRPHNITPNTCAIYSVHRTHPHQPCDTCTTRTKHPYSQHALNTEHTHSMSIHHIHSTPPHTHAIFQNRAPSSQSSSLTPGTHTMHTHTLYQ